MLKLPWMWPYTISWAKRFDRPVYQLLGGGYRNKRIPIAHSLGLMAIDAAVEEAIQVVAEGVKHIKVKGGLDFKRDLELIKKLRETLGPDITPGFRPESKLSFGQRGYPMVHAYGRI